MKTSEKIIKIITKAGQISVSEIVDKLGISRQYVHRVISDLEEKGKVKKIGSPPKVYYSIDNSNRSSPPFEVGFEIEIFLKEHFIIVDALGNLLSGIEAMDYWCSRQNLPLTKTINEFIETRKKYLDYFNDNHIIDGLQKLQTTKGIGNIGVDQLFYLDFYAIERFGKTKLGTLMHYAKQGQNKNLMKMVVSEIKHSISRIIVNKGITAVVYVPPTIKRQLQIMQYLEKNLIIDLPKVKVEKVNSPIVVPQKALSKIFERVANAKNTFIVPNQTKHEHVLIIDDAVGSGATINEIALKLKEKNITKKITGLAITGSYKDFEVISEL